MVLHGDGGVRSFRTKTILYNDHFVQRPFHTKETITYKSTGVTSYKDFVYEVVPEFLHTRVEESFRTRILCTRIFVYYGNKIRAMSMLMLLLLIMQSIEFPN